MKYAVQAIVLSVLSVTSSAAYEAQNNVIVNPISGTTFEVIEGGGFGARSTWCAATEYAQRQLGADWRDRVYVAEARSASRTMPGRTGTVFTTTAVPSENARGFSVVSRTIRTVGSSLSVQRGLDYCRDNRLRRSN